MDRDALLEELLQLAERLGVRVRVERFSGTASSGGLIRLRGEPVVMLDARSGAPERAAVLARALAGFDYSGLPMSEDLAAWVRRRGRVPTGEKPPRSLLRPKPGLRRTAPVDNQPPSPIGVDDATPTYGDKTAQKPKHEP